MRPADDVQMPVLLALHGVVAEVREQPEAARAEGLTNLHGNTADASDILPQLVLGSVFLRHCEQHYRRPAEDVLDHDNLVVLVHDVRRLVPCHDVAEDAIRAHVARSMVRAVAFAHNRERVRMGA